MMLLLNMVYKSKTRKQKHDSTTICCGASVRMHSYSVRTTFLIFKKKNPKLVTQTQDCCQSRWTVLTSPEQVEMAANEAERFRTYP